MNEKVFLRLYNQEEALSILTILRKNEYFHINSADYKTIELDIISFFKYSESNIIYNKLFIHINYENKSYVFFSKPLTISEIRQDKLKSIFKNDNIF